MILCVSATSITKKDIALQCLYNLNHLLVKYNWQAVIATPCQYLLTLNLILLWKNHITNI